MKTIEDRAQETKNVEQGINLKTIEDRAQETKNVEQGINFNENAIKTFGYM